MTRVAALLCMALAGFIAPAAFAQDEDAGLPLPDLRPPRVATPNIEGKWVTRNGTRIDISQQGGEVTLRGASGREYRGKLQGRRLQLEHTYATVDDVPEAVPERLRPAMLGTRLPFEGEVAQDGQSIAAETVEVEVEPDALGTTIARRTERRSRVTLTRFKEPPQIAAIVVDADQTARREGRALYRHPSNDRLGFGTRTLLVLGRHLPTAWGEVKVESADPAVEYTVLKLAGDLSDRYQDDLRRALAYLSQKLEPASFDAAGRMDKMLVRAQFRGDVLPGTQTLTLNGQRGTWKLEFGDTFGELEFVREVNSAFEATQELFLPETVSLELRVTARLALDSIDVFLAQPGTPGAGPWMLAAKRASERRTEDGWEVRYRTPPIQLVEGGRAAAAAPNAVRIVARPGEQLIAELDDDELLQAEPAPGTLFTAAGPAPEQVAVAATVRRTPAQLGKSWKEALTTAARCAGRPVEDFSTLGGREAAEITNYILFTTDDLARRILTRKPFYERKLKVTVSDHAAMLLLRDEYVAMMQEQRRRLPDVGDEATLRGFRQLIAPYADNRAFPLSYLRVAPPAGGARGCGPGSLDVAFGQVLQTLLPVRFDAFRDSCPFGFAFNKFFLERTFAGDARAAERWSLDAVKEGFETYRAAVDKGIAEARDMDACKVEDLLRLTGYGFGPVAQRLLPRLVRLEESGGAMSWVPDRPARGAVSGLGDLAAAVRAQEDYSDLDTQCIVLTASAIALVPALVSGAPLAALATAGANAAIAGGDVAYQVNEYFEREAEYRRSLGGSLALGTGRLGEAEVRRTSAWQIALALANAGLAGFEVASAISQVNRATALARGAELVREIESGGTAALRRLSDEDKANVLAYIADTELTRAARGEAALSDAQRSALRAARKLDSDPRVAAELARLNGLDPGNAVERELGRLVNRDPDAVKRAHLVGEGQVGKDGVRPAGIGNYTASQLREKARILRSAGYTADETRLLVEEGIVGLKINVQPKFGVQGLSNRPTQGWLRTVDGTEARMRSPRTRKGGSRDSWDWSSKARERFEGNRRLREMAAEAAQHAEGQAAKWMWQRLDEGNPVSKAWLDINNDYICWKCFETLPELLPPGSKLTVRLVPGTRANPVRGPLICERNGFVRSPDGKYYSRTFESWN